MAFVPNVGVIYVVVPDVVLEEWVVPDVVLEGVVVVVLEGLVPNVVLEEWVVLNVAVAESHAEQEVLVSNVVLYSDATAVFVSYVVHLKIADAKPRELH